MTDPASRLREGVNPSRLIEVKTKGGASILVGPCLITPREILTGRLTAYQCAVMELRNTWARWELFSGTKMDVSTMVWAQVAIGAIKANYSLSDSEMDDLQLGEDYECLVSICAAACGRIDGILAAQRTKALNVAILGLCDVPLSPNEIAGLSDFAVNAGRAPGIG